MVTPKFLILPLASRQISSICREGDGRCYVILLLPNKITPDFTSFNFEFVNFHPGLDLSNAVLKSVY